MPIYYYMPPGEWEDAPGDDEAPDEESVFEFVRRVWNNTRWGWKHWIMGFEFIPVDAVEDAYIVLHRQPQHRLDRFGKDMRGYNLAVLDRRPMEIYALKEVWDHPPLRTSRFPSNTEYRIYVLNHELGHVLGLHKHGERCDGAGKAPVMMQHTRGHPCATSSAWPGVADGMRLRHHWDTLLLQAWHASSRGSAPKVVHAMLVEPPKGLEAWERVMPGGGGGSEGDSEGEGEDESEE